MTCINEDKQDADTLLKRASAWEAEAWSWERMGNNERAAYMRKEAERLFKLAMQRD